MNMSVPCFASAYRRPYNQAVGGLQARKLCKRKRGAKDREHTEQPNVDEDTALSAELIQAEDLETEVAATSRKSSSAGLRQQHYSVLTSLLHRCILDKDYARASRAWGMLLRTELGGHPLDIRAHERWGIGAELLLHGHTPPAGRMVNTAGQRETQDKGLIAHGTKAIQEGLTKAKEYYERLILQFPYRKTAPDATSSLTFYPVMFGIWIYSIQLRYGFALHESLQDQKSSSREALSNDSNSDSGYSASRVADSQLDSKIAIRQTAEQDAYEIAESLSELLVSPPYSDHPGLWKTKGMLLLWISHLLDYETLSAEQTDNSGNESIPNHREREHSVTKSRERQDAVMKTQQAFSRALVLGETLDTRIREEVVL